MRVIRRLRRGGLRFPNRSVYCAPYNDNSTQAPGSRERWSADAGIYFGPDLAGMIERELGGGNFWPLPCPVAFPRVLSHARHMDLLTHDELARLTPPERLTLISQLWDSLEDDQLPLTAAQRAELDRRLERLDQDRREGITWAALKTELEQRCP